MLPLGITDCLFRNNSDKEYAKKHLIEAMKIGKTYLLSYLSKLLHLELFHYTNAMLTILKLPGNKERCHSRTEYLIVK